MFDYGQSKGYRLSADLEGEILEIEKRVVATLQLTRLKRVTSPISSPKRSRRSSSVGLRLRDRILRRDGYRCIFCGRKGPATPLEVNHIIPRSLISKLDLDNGLDTAEENLCTTCFECNRGKSDKLASEDIGFYINALAEPPHPNHGIVKYLLAIRRLQEGK